MCEEAGIDSKDIIGFTPRTTLNRLMVENDVPIEYIRVQFRLKPFDPMAVYIALGAAPHGRG